VWPSEEEYEAWYGTPAYHRDEPARYGCAPFVDRRGEHEVAARSRIELIEYYAKHHVPRKEWYPSLCDIGAGGGSFLRIAQKRHLEVCGVEPNPNVNFHLAYVTREVITKGTWRDVPAECMIYTMFDVFEHLTRPNDCLQHLLSVMMPQGFLMIEMPEVNAPLGAWERHIKPREHLCLYTAESAAKMWEKHGLVPIMFYRPLGGTIGKQGWLLGRARQCHT
jgi:2-polyprenyl-3-methyl-5-hydroxy-6-metoxy-1,4-benzoquinol methylase